jgi:hypothetical protein
LDIEFVFNEQEPHERIVVHWPRLVIGGIMGGDRAGAVDFARLKMNILS